MQVQLNISEDEEETWKKPGKLRAGDLVGRCMWEKDQPARLTTLCICVFVCLYLLMGKLIMYLILWLVDALGKDCPANLTTSII